MAEKNKKLVVFTAFLLEKESENPKLRQKTNEVVDSWYPTIYFYSIGQ